MMTHRQALEVLAAHTRMVNKLDRAQASAFPGGLLQLSRRTFGRGKREARRSPKLERSGISAYGSAERRDVSATGQRSLLSLLAMLYAASR